MTDDEKEKSKQFSDAHAEYWRNSMEEIARRHNQILEEFIRVRLSAELVLRGDCDSIFSGMMKNWTPEMRQEHYYRALAHIVKDVELVRDESKAPEEIRWYFRMRPLDVKHADAIAEVQNETQD